MKPGSGAALSAILLLALALPAPAFAHITLEQPTAAAGSTYKAVFRVPHGCAGSPTRAITVYLPDGVNGAKPMPKPGWTLDVRNEKLATPDAGHGEPVTERATQVTWRGGRLLDSEYDEFIVRLTLPAQTGTLRFHVLQECERGSNDWAAIPAEGAPKPAFPAPALDVLPADPHAGHHMH